jgi:hypothetical protein
MTEIVRAWLALESPEAQSLVPSACAKPSTIRFNPEEKTLSFQLNPCPERNAILMGSRWRQAEGRFTGLFRGRASGRQGVLTSISAGYSIDSNDLLTAEFKAYCEPRGEERMEAQAIAIVPHTPETMAMRLSPGGIFEASPDLEGKEIHCQVTYGQGIVLSGEPLGLATGYLLTRDPGLTCVALKDSSIQIHGDVIQLTYKSKEEVRLG